MQVVRRAQRDSTTLKRLQMRVLVSRPCFQILVPSQDHRLVVVLGVACSKTRSRCITSYKSLLAVITSGKNTRHCARVRRAKHYCFTMPLITDRCYARESRTFNGLLLLRAHYNAFLFSIANDSRRPACNQLSTNENVCSNSLHTVQRRLCRFID